MKRSVKNIILTVALTLVSSSVFAASVSTTNVDNITASVVGSCRWITPLDMAFGVYDPFAVPPTTAAATVQFKCIKKTNATDTYKIWFSKTAGNMVSGAELLAYTLTDTASAALPTTAATAVTVAGTAGIGGAAGYSFTVNGSVAAGQDVAVGAYVDTVVVTVEY